MKLEELINIHYDDLNKNEKMISQMILADRQRFLNYSSQSFADNCHISRATLLRFCRKIGLTSFSDLKLLMKEETIPVQQEENIYDIYHALIEELRKFSYRSICEKIYHAKTIYIYGTGNEQKTLAEECKRIFLTVGKCVIDLFDDGEVAFMKHAFQKDDMFIIISLSGETKEGIRILEHIASTHIPCVSITRLANNTISSLCDMNLYVATKVLDHQDYELVSAFYVLLDLLFINYLDYCKEIDHES